MFSGSRASENVRAADGSGEVTHDYAPPNAHFLTGPAIRCEGAPVPILPATWGRIKASFR